MSIEIERKFLVIGTEWRNAKSIHIRQGYLCREIRNTVRIQLADQRAYLTIKGIKQGISRPEYEYEIPAADAEQLLKLCDGITIEKYRHIIEYGNFTWKVDEFLGENKGLVHRSVYRSGHPLIRSHNIGANSTNPPNP